LLDEPLGALDLKLRRQMQIELKRIQMEVGTTFVHVTHDQEEAMTMADTVAVMNEGRIEQMGAPADIYELPETVFVARFLGQSNLFAGRRESSGSDSVTVAAHGQQFTIPNSRNNAPGGDVIVGVRPEKMTIVDAGDPIPDAHDRIAGRVVDVSYTGVSTQYLVKTSWGEEISVFEQNDVVGDQSAVGDSVEVHWARDHAFGLDGTGTSADDVESAMPVV
jgi:spermidine/putrescine transport system ATP-binding protein